MAIITLTTDFGLKDHFVAAVKGLIYSELPEVKIVDISHELAPFNIQECAYVLENAYRHFPKGTIHVIGMDSEPSADKKHIVVLLNGHYFVTANTGVIGLIANEAAPEKVMEIQLPNAVHNAFPTANIFVKVACHIARGGTLEVVGKPFTALKALKEFSPRILEDGKQIIGSVIYIDNYGNVVTSIKKHHFEAYRNGRAFEIQVRNHKLRSIFKAYSDIEQNLGPKEKRRGDGDLLAIFNSSDYLELAIYRSNLRTVGGASTLLGLEYRDTITISFG